MSEADQGSRFGRAQLRLASVSGLCEIRVLRPMLRPLACAVRIGSVTIDRFSVAPLRPRRSLFATRRVRPAHALLVAGPQAIRLWDERRDRALATLTLGDEGAPLLLGHADPLDGGLATGWAARRPRDDAPLAVAVDIEDAEGARGATLEFRSDLFAAVHLTQAGFRLRLPVPGTARPRAVRLTVQGVLLPGGEQIWSAEQQELAAFCARFVSGAALGEPHSAIGDIRDFAGWLNERPALARDDRVAVGEALLGSLGMLMALGRDDEAVALLAGCPPFAAALAHGDGRLDELIRGLVGAAAPSDLDRLAPILEAAGDASPTMAALALWAKTRRGGSRAAAALTALEEIAVDSGAPTPARLLAYEGLGSHRCAQASA